MEPSDICTLLVVLFSISFYGLYKAGRSKQCNSRDMLIGSGMSVWSIALSVCSTFISSISLLGFPAEVYYYGTMIGWYGAVYFVAFPMVAYVFLPPLYNLKLNSLYEYLELRFSKSCKTLALTVFCTQTILYNSVALYVPSLAVSTTTGLPLALSISMTAVLSAAYICFGGAKAGVHTSAMQMLLIFVTMGTIVVINILHHPLGEALLIAKTEYRLEINDFRLDPRIRHSFWSITIGGTCNILSLFAANQLSIQRFIAMPTLKQAQKVVLINIVCNLFILVSYIFAGLLIFRRYYECDPQLPNINELFPHFVLDSFSHLPGMIGLFTAAVYSAGISTLSGSFSAVSTVIIKDIIVPQSETRYSEDALVTLSKVLPFGLAIITMVLAWICQYIKSLALQIAFSVFGAVGGPILGSFIVGLFIPSVKGNSGVVGMAVSLVTCLTIACGAIFNQISPVRLPLNSECTDTFTNRTLTPENFGRVLPMNSESIWVNITEVSYQYYGPIGVLVNILVSLIYNRIFEWNKGKAVRSDLLSTLVSPKTNQSQDEVTSSPLI